MIALALGAIFIFVSKNFVEAKVLISEVKTNDSSEFSRFVELYNYSSSTENLSGWKMCKYTKSGSESEKVSLIDDFSNILIKPFGYLLIADSELVGSSTSDVIFSKGNLTDNNYLYLLNNYGAVVDSFGWGSVTSAYHSYLFTPTYSGSVKSFSRLPNNDTGNWQDTDIDTEDFETTTPSPQNSSSASRPEYISDTTTTPTSTIEIPTSTPEIPTTTPDISTTTTSTVPAINTSSIWAQIKINEFVSNPESGNEWVEFFNPSTSSLDLSGGYICDEHGADSLDECKNISGAIGAGGWLFYDLLTTRYMSNVGDSIFLKNVEGEIVDEIIYEKNTATEKGQSFARKIDGADTNSISDWALTITTTPGAKNVIIAPIVSSGGGSSKTVDNTGDTKTVTVVSSSTAYLGLVLNEILPNPIGADTENEFIEIFNTTSASIDLSGWKISDKAKSFTLSGSILAKSYLYFLRSETNIALNNTSGEEVKLIAPDDKLADYISYNSADEGAAYARTASGTWQWTTSSTPGAQNYFFNASVVYDTSTPAVEKIIFSEICPNPRGADAREFIEIFNNDSEPIDVGNWTIANLKKRFVIPEETIIYPGQYLVFYKAVSKLTLNNSQEELILRNAFGQTADSVKIAAAKESMSYARANDAWQWTEESTPAKENKIVITPAEEKSVSTKNKTVYRAMSIAGAREVEEESGVVVRGVVSALPGNFGVQYFYIFDGHDGIQIYNAKKDFLKFKINDQVEITGVVGEASGIKRIRAKNKEAMDILSTDNILKPMEKSLDKISEDDAGRLVAVEGDITEIKSNYMYLDNQLGEIKIYFKKGANINKSAHTEGEQVRVVGIVESAGDGVQIWPRSNADIISVSSTQKVAGEKISSDEEKDVASKTPLFAFLGLTGAVILGFVIKNYGASVIAKFKK